MNCYLSAMLGGALLVGSIATLSISEEQHNVLRNVFSDELDQKYNKIIDERRNHYIVGLLIGLIISFIVIKYINIDKYFEKLTLVLSITLGTAVMFYSLMPKSDYILNHLKTPEENQKWLEVYKTMKQRYFIGLLLGLSAAIPLANSFC